MFFLQVKNIYIYKSSIRSMHFNTFMISSFYVYYVESFVAKIAIKRFSLTHLCLFNNNKGQT